MSLPISVSDHSSDTFCDSYSYGQQDSFRSVPSINSEQETLVNSSIDIQLSSGPSSDQDKQKEEEQQGEGEEEKEEAKNYNIDTCNTHEEKRERKHPHITILSKKNKDPSWYFFLVFLICISISVQVIVFFSFILSSHGYGPISKKKLLAKSKKDVNPVGKTMGSWGRCTGGSMLDMDVDIPLLCYGICLEYARPLPDIYYLKIPREERLFEWMFIKADMESGGHMQSFEEFESLRHDHEYFHMIGRNGWQREWTYFQNLNPDKKVTYESASATWKTEDKAQFISICKSLHKAYTDPESPVSSIIDQRNPQLFGIVLGTALLTMVSVSPVNK